MNDPFLNAASAVDLPRSSLGFFPTPLVELSRLTARLGGPRLLMKRDDQTGLALGGNKTRKLEYLIGDALAKGCDTVVTAGAAQSNHCRQTAAAAARSGLACYLALGGSPPPAARGNLLLDGLLGARVHWCGADRKGERLDDIVGQLEGEGLRPYLIPYGGSNGLGAAAFVEAARELKCQLAEAGMGGVTHVVFASSSGGTQAGLTLGSRLYGLGCELIGVQVDKGEAGDEPYADRLQQLSGAAAGLLGVEARFAATDFEVSNAFAGPGYGVVSDLERRAIELLAADEGILLDPVYTGRAMGGLIQMIEQGRFSSNDTVLFWHTGGTPALFAYEEHLVGQPG